jgi:hypothetical protein
MNLKPVLRRRLLIAAGAFVVVMLALFFGLPPIIKAQAEARLSELLGRTVTLGRVKLDPVRLAVTLDNFEIREKDARAAFLSCSRLYVNFDALSSLGGDWVLSEVELDGFRAAAAINADGSYNVSDLIAKFSVPGAKAGAAPRPVRVGSLQVRTARVDFSDRSRAVAFATGLGPISFKLSNFRTAGDSAAPLSFRGDDGRGRKVHVVGHAGGGAGGLARRVLGRRCPVEKICALFGR